MTDINATVTKVQTRASESPESREVEHTEVHLDISGPPGAADDLADLVIRFLRPTLVLDEVEPTRESLVAKVKRYARYIWDAIVLAEG